jgi:hypothetical protein
MVMPTLPVEGVSLLLGSDLAGEMAIMNPIVYDEPSYEDNELENTEVFSACVVTRDMRAKLEEDNLKDGSTEASDVALKTHCLLMSMITFYMVMATCLIILHTQTNTPVKI